MRRRGEPGWVRARAALEAACAARFGPKTKVEIGRVVRIGDGLTCDAFAAAVDLGGVHADASDAYVVTLPRGGHDPARDQRIRRAHDLLARLQAVPLPFLVPAPLAVVDLDGQAVLVQRFIRGVELDLRAGRQGTVGPWNNVGEIAAALHAVDAGGFADLVPGPPTRRAAALAALATAFDGLDRPEARAARAWAAAHLPPDEPSVLVHGDLLGPNILLTLRDDIALAVIDWEYAELGDPAADLAIVTRGQRQPFQTAGGLDLLLDAYRAHGGRADVSRAHVRLFELCLLAGWYRASLAGDGVQPADALARLRAHVRRAEAGGD